MAETPTASAESVTDEQQQQPAQQSEQQNLAVTALDLESPGCLYWQHFQQKIVQNHPPQM
jgi:hypothetical protein